MSKPVPDPSSHLLISSDIFHVNVKNKLLKYWIQTISSRLLSGAVSTTLPSRFFCICGVGLSAADDGFRDSAIRCQQNITGSTSVPSQLRLKGVSAYWTLVPFKVS